MKKFFVRLYRIFIKICLWFLITSIISVIIFRWLPVPFTPFMFIQSIRQVVDSKRELQFKKKWVSLDKISPNLRLAVICSEDQNFFEHHGFDFDAIERAWKHNEDHRHKWGASTISQQEAKNVFLYDGRNWVRKGFETYFTFLTELIWGKERIMEVYLNVIEFGDGIYGAEAASQIYFKIPAKKLTRGQAALLAAILPAPRRFSVTHPSAYIRQRQAWILQQMNNHGNELKY